jgi:hypothetical protein
MQTQKRLERQYSGKLIKWNKDGGTALFVGDGKDENMSHLVPDFAIFDLVDKPYFIIETSFSQPLEDAMLKMNTYFKSSTLIAALIIDITEDRSDINVFPDEPPSKPFLDGGIFVQQGDIWMKRWGQFEKNGETDALVVGSHMWVGRLKCCFRLFCRDSTGEPKLTSEAVSSLFYFTMTYRRLNIQCSH